MENMTAIEEYLEKKEVGKPSSGKKYNLRGFFYVNVDTEAELVKELDFGIAKLNPNLDRNAKGFRKKGILAILFRALQQQKEASSKPQPQTATAPKKQ